MLTCATNTYVIWRLALADITLTTLIWCISIHDEQLELYFIFCTTINFTTVDYMYENISNKEMLISDGGCLSARVRISEILY
jgi:hypothetical protein